MKVLKKLRYEVVDKTQPEVYVTYTGGLLGNKPERVTRPPSDPHYVVEIYRGKKTWVAGWKCESSKWHKVQQKISEGCTEYIGWSDNEGDKKYYYLYMKNAYESEIFLPKEDVALIVEQERESKEERLKNQVERIKAKAEIEGVVRTRIPDNIQIMVWNRDGGKCVRCGSQQKLEFDHIIPVSKGGNNTARNIQLLCEMCNRGKGSKIGG